MSFKIKKSVIAAIASISLLVPLLVPGISSAACSGNIANGVSNGIDTVTGGSGATGVCNGTQGISSGLGTIAKTAINIISILVGIVAVIMIIFAGFKYITSGGESNGVTSAKNSLIYAIVGLVIVVLAQAIVHIVFTTSSGISSNIAGTIRLFVH
jgi:hypothetical protein